MHSLLLYNGEIRDASDPLISPGQTGFMNGWGVFSTLRVYEGVLFAFERHYTRMRHDAQLTRVPMSFSAAQLEQWLSKLVEANAVVNGTLRVAVVRNRGGAFEGSGIERDADVIAFTTELTDWGSGVKLYYVRQGRHAASPFAGAKVTSWLQNLAWNEEAHERGFDEVILLNERGEISECTSANIFVISGDNVWTPPLNTSGCLPGVTRAILLEEIHVPGISIAERNLTPAELEAADQVFITSTTRNLLPVLEIEGRRLRQSSSVIAALSQEFERYQAFYAAHHAMTKEAVHT
ncbi:MAG: aminotransferase class IV [Bryobacteraceae bacterium]